ncbi:hypothetical protein EJB05_10331, partial [Eragrostis curvula]
MELPDVLSVCMGWHVASFRSALAFSGFMLIEVLLLAEQPDSLVSGLGHFIGCYTFGVQSNIYLSIITNLPHKIDSHQHKRKRIKATSLRN